MKNPFSVGITGLRDRPGARLEVNVEGPIPELAVSASAVRENDSVSFAGAVEAIEAGQEVVAVGVVKGQWHGECRRCLQDAIGDITTKVREIFELEPVEGDTYRLQGEVVDLQPMIRDAIILELPEAPLCRSDCAGLCVECGTNLNESSCDCVQPAGDMRWAALDVLKADQS